MNDIADNEILRLLKINDGDGTAINAQGRYTVVEWTYYNSTKVMELIRDNLEVENVNLLLVRGEDANIYFSYVNLCGATVQMTIFQGDVLCFGPFGDLYVVKGDEREKLSVLKGWPTC